MPAGTDKGADMNETPNAPLAELTTRKDALQAAYDAAEAEETQHQAAADVAKARRVDLGVLIDEYDVAIGKLSDE